jgi:hypothetical protein
VIGAITAGLFSAGTPPVTNSYESIATVTVGGGGSSSISFTSIPATFKHLQIRGIARGNGGAFYDRPLLQFNSDTGSNYSWHYLEGYNTSAGAGAGASQTFISEYYAAAGAGAGASVFGAMVLDILDYADTNKYKTTRSLAGIDSNTVGGALQLASGSWRNTAAISTITLSGFTFQQYSSFALYGIKG